MDRVGWEITAGRRSRVVGPTVSDFRLKTKTRWGSVPYRVMASNEMVLTVSPASCSGNALASQGLTLFATTELTRFLVAFFQLQAFEETIVLNFLLQNAHGLFEIVVENFDFNCFQTGSTPFFPITPSNGLGCFSL